MTETIAVELNTQIADSLLTFTDQLGAMFGAKGYGPNNALYHLKLGIENGKMKLEQEQAKAVKPAYKTVLCPVEKATHIHDCWILHKPSKTVYYAPFGHHHQLIAYLLMNCPGVIKEDWHKSDTADAVIRTGDVKGGKPRTCNENPVTSKKLRPVLIKAYNDARGI